MGVGEANVARITINPPAIITHDVSKPRMAIMVTWVPVIPKYFLLRRGLVVFIICTIDKQTAGKYISGVTAVAVGRPVARPPSSRTRHIWRRGGR